MLNHITITGNLTADPELRKTGGGIPWCSFTVACERDRRDPNGEREVDFLPMQSLPIRRGDDVLQFKKLPRECYHVMEVSNEIIRVVRGMQGYYPTDIPTVSRDHAQMLADKMNKELGVTKAQAEAMFVGSLFGWNVPGADPDNYDEEGKPCKVSRRVK